MTAETLFLAIGTADEEFLEQSEQTAAKRPSRWRAWAAAACLCLVLLSPWVIRNFTGLGGCAPKYPGGFQPVLQVNGELYYWDVIIHHENEPQIHDSMEEIPRCSHLTDGFEAIGEISSVTKKAPTEDFQIQAGISVRGIVYANPEAPLVVYVYVDTDWLEGCVRFVHADYQSRLIRFKGQLYWFRQGNSKLAESLPEGCVSAGRIQAVVQDRIPDNDLETNGLLDSYGGSLLGREIFYDPEDNSVIYLAEEQYWSGGHYPAWRACRLWEGD